MNGVLYWQTIGLSKYDRTTGAVTAAGPIYNLEPGIDASRTQYITFYYTYNGEIYTDAQDHILPHQYEPFKVGDELDMYVRPDHPHDYYIVTKTGRTTAALIGFAVVDAAVTMAFTAFLIGIKTGRTK